MIDLKQTKINLYGFSVQSLTSKENEPQYQANSASKARVNPSPGLEPVPELAVETLQLSVRSQNCLRNARITTVAELLRLSDQELLAIPSFGIRSLREIKSKLGELLQVSGAEHGNVPLSNLTRLDLPQEVIERLRTKINTLPLSFRIRDRLQREELSEIWQLIRITEADVLNIRNLGRKSYEKLKKYIEKLGFRFGMQFTLEQIDTLRTYVYADPNSPVCPDIDFQSTEVLRKLKTKVSDLPLSFRSRGCLEKKIIFEVWQLVQITEEDLLNTRNLGRKSYRELREHVEKLGFRFGMRFTPEQIDTLRTYVYAAPNSPIRPDIDLQSTEVLKKLRTWMKDLPLSFRSRGCLEKKIIFEVWQLVQMTEKDLLKIKNLGRKSCKELREHVEKLGFRFGMRFTQAQINAIRAYVCVEPGQPLPKLIHKVLTTLGIPPLPFLNAKENLVVNERFFKVGKPKTLESIALRLSVSRERIRQLEKTASNKIKQQVKKELREINTTIKEKVRKSGGLVNIDIFDNELTSLSDQDQAIISRLLALIDETLFIDWEGGLVSSKGEEWIFTLCDEIKGQLFQDESNRFFTRQELSEAVRKVTCRHGLFPGQNVHNLIQLFCQIKKISVVKDFLCFGRVTKQDNILLAFKKFFPKGLEIYKRRDELLQSLQEFDYEMFHQASPRSILARLAEHPDVLLWGRGFFIHKDHVSYDPLIVEKVAGWVVVRFDRGHSRFQIDVPFNAFRIHLQSAGIPNQYALYVLLRRVGNTRIGQRKFPTLVDMEADIDIREGILAELESYFLEAGRAVPYEDLKEEFLVRRGWKIYSLQQNITIHTDLIYPWQDNSYIHMEYMQVNEARLEEFLTVLRHKLDSIQGAFSLKGAKREMNVLWEQVCPGASVRTMIKLIRSVDPDDLYIEGYFIKRIDASSEAEGFSVVGEFEEYFLEQGTELSKFQLRQEFCQGRGWTDNQYYNAFRQSRLFKSGKNSLLHPSVINWNETLSRQVHEVLTSLILERNKNRHPHMQIEPLIYKFLLPELPHDIQWTKQLLQSVGAEYGDFIFFDDAYIRVNNEFDIEDLDDMIAFLIARHFPLGIAKRKEVEHLLWREGILESGKAIPEDQYFEDSSIVHLVESDEIGLSPTGYERYEGVFKSERFAP